MMVEWLINEMSQTYAADTEIPLKVQLPGMTPLLIKKRTYRVNSNGTRGQLCRAPDNEMIKIVDLGNVSKFLKKVINRDKM